MPRVRYLIMSCGCCYHGIRSDGAECRYCHYGVYYLSPSDREWAWPGGMLLGAAPKGTFAAELARRSANRKEP